MEFRDEEHDTCNEWEEHIYPAKNGIGVYGVLTKPRP